MQNRDNLTIVGLTWSRGTSGHRAAILRSENTTMNGTRGKCRCRRIALRLKAGGSLAAEFVECLNRTRADRGGRIVPPAADPSHATGRVKRHDNQLHPARVLEVRIHLPPAENLLFFKQKTAYDIQVERNYW